MTYAARQTVAVTFGLLALSDGMEAQLDHASTSSSVSRQIITTQPQLILPNVTRSAEIMTNAATLDRDLGCCHTVWYDTAYVAGVPDRAPAVGGAVETFVAVLPPRCGLTIIENITYVQCGSVWYAPMFVSDRITYVVITPPR